MAGADSEANKIVLTRARSGAGCLGVFGFIFAAAGLVFAFFVAKEFLGVLEARGWEQVPATIIESDIEVSSDRAEPFAIRARFSYEVGGRKYSSDRYGMKERRSDSYEKLALELKEIREREDLVAHVDPDDPGVAVLDPGSLSFGFMILLPLMFVPVGIACMVGAVRMARAAGKGAGTQALTGRRALSSSPTRSKAGAGVGIIVGVVFALAGLGLLYPLAIWPLSHSVAAKNWVETPCKIVWAKVKSHDSDDGTTYSVDIFYSYEFDGQQHRSNRYGFIGGSSSGRKGKQEVVNRYRKDKNPVCYVDPELPERAVLKRELGAAGLLALIPLGLILIGGPLSLHSVRVWRKGRKRAESSEESTTTAATVAQRAPPARAAKTFAPGKSRVTTAFVLLLIALFWNGIVFGFLFREAWLGDGGWFLRLSSLPFMAVGVLLAVGFLYTALAIFNPQVVITLEPGEPELGVPAVLKWQFKGSTGRLRRLRIAIRGLERASYRRGTDTVTDTSTFFGLVLAEETRAMEMYRGSVPFTLPHDLMHSLKLSNNAICWRVEVAGEIAFWPDVADKFDLEVHPYPVK